MSDLICRKTAHDNIGETELFALLSKEELRECGCHFDEEGEFYFTEEQWPMMAALLIAMRKYINSQPAVDAVRVVRCRDCCHSEDRKTYLRCVRRGFNHGYEVKPNGFCNYGESREVEIGGK